MLPSHLIMSWDENLTFQDNTLIIRCIFVCSVMVIGKFHEAKLPQRMDHLECNLCLRNKFFYCISNQIICGINMTNTFSSSLISSRFSYLFKKSNLPFLAVSSLLRPQTYQSVYSDIQLKLQNRLACR